MKLNFLITLCLALFIACSTKPVLKKKSFFTHFNDIGTTVETDYIVRPNNLVALRSKFIKPSLIAAVQNKLNNNGFPVGPADGYIGKRTIAGIKKFQKMKKLTMTGRLNADTLKALGLNRAQFTSPHMANNIFAE